MKHVAAVKNNKPVEIMFTSVAQAAIVEDLRDKVRPIYSDDESANHAEPIGVRIHLGSIATYSNGLTNKDSLLSWLEQNKIDFELKSKNGKTLEEMKSLGTELGYSTYDITIDVTNFESVRKLAVAGFKFDGAKTLRDHQSHLAELHGAKRSGPAGN